MKYLPVINAIGQFFQSEARVFTRYNNETEKKVELEQFTYETRHTKFVVVDYKDTADSTSSFKIKLMQIHNSVTIPTTDFAIKMVGKEDTSFYQIDPDNYSGELPMYLAAIRQAGMERPGAMTRVIRDITNILKLHLPKEQKKTAIRVSASEAFGRECVALFVQFEDTVLIIQISE